LQISCVRSARERSSGPRKSARLFPAKTQIPPRPAPVLAKADRDSARCKPSSPLLLAGSVLDPCRDAPAILSGHISGLPALSSHKILLVSREWGEEFDEYKTKSWRILVRILESVHEHTISVLIPALFLTCTSAPQPHTRLLLACFSLFSFPAFLQADVAAGIYACIYADERVLQEQR
jgi:hypothetical protein